MVSPESPIDSSTEATPIEAPQEKKLYIGSSLIISEETHAPGQTKVTLQSENPDGSTIETTEIFADVMLPHIRTEEPVDATKLRELRCDPIINKIVTLFVEFDIFFGVRNNVHNEVDYIFNEVSSALIGMRYRAEDLLWGNSEYDRKLSDIVTVLGKNGLLNEDPEAR